jgi:uncharacterized protein (DUF1800 family)
VDAEVETRRRLHRYQASRRTFLAGAAATGVGAAVAAMWNPLRLGGSGAQPTSASTHAGGALPETLGAAALAPGGAAVVATRQQATDISAQIAHLLRRTGFSATPQQVAYYSKLGIAGAVDALLTWDSSKDPGLDYANAAGLDLTKVADAQRWWLLRMMYTNRPLQEKLTLFWHGILTSAVYKVETRWLNTMLTQNEFLRANALGTTETLLKGISRDPAMMVWLDLQTSTKAHPNENFARELQELFSLGIGNYSEDDVREAARAFTGYALDKDRHFVYNAKNFDNGSKTYLDQSGAFSGDDIINIIGQQRAHATYIATRLWKFFASPTPDDATIGALADTFQSSNHGIKAVLRQMLTMPQFYGDDVVNAIIKSPVDFVVGTVQSLGLATNAANYPAFMQQMNQELFNPPNVAGWPGGQDWLASGSFFARMNFLTYVVYNKDLPPDAGSLLGGYNGADPNSVLSTAGQALLGKPLSSSTQQAIMQFLSDSNKGTAAVTDGNVKSMLYLVLGSPESMLI